MADASAREILHFRPHLEPPRYQRSDSAEEIPETETPLERTFPGVPAGALDYLESLPETPVPQLIQEAASRVRSLVGGLTRLAPPMGGITADRYLSAEEPEASVYESAAIHDGQSLPAMLMPVARELDRTVGAAEELVSALEEFLPENLEAFLDELNKDLEARNYGSAAPRLVPLAAMKSVSDLASHLSSLCTVLEEMVSTAPIDGLGQSPVDVIAILAGNPSLRQSASSLLSAQEGISLAECIRALQRRKRIPADVVLRKISSALPGLIRHREAISRFLQHPQVLMSTLSEFTETVISRSDRALHYLQSLLGDISRVGALMHLEWQEYMQTSRQRFLLLHTRAILERIDGIRPEDADGWLSRQGDLIRRLSLAEAR